MRGLFVSMDIRRFHVHFSLSACRMFRLHGSELFDITPPEQ